MQDLIKALEVGSNYPPSSISHGSALQVEDLQVTLRLITFMCPIFIHENKFNRFLKNLNNRNINYVLRTKKLKHIMDWNLKLKIGKRTILFKILK